MAKQTLESVIPLLGKSYYVFFHCLTQLLFEGYNAYFVLFGFCNILGNG